MKKIKIFYIVWYRNLENKLHSSTHGEFETEEHDYLDISYKLREISKGVSETLNSSSNEEITGFEIDLIRHEEI